MSLEENETEKRAIDKLAGDYEAKGFRVHRGAVLPFTTQGGSELVVDLLADKGDEHHVIEVKRRGAREESREWGELAKEVRSRRGWHFHVVFVDQEATEVAASERIAATIADAEALLQGGNLTAAILLAGSAFEASGQRRLQALGALPRAIASVALVERLVSEGQLEQDDFVPLRDAIELRNAVAHGRLDAPASRETAERLVTSAKRLLQAA